jgi:hypothetical protein
VHRNAPLTPEGRLRLCRLIERGWTVSSAAESFRISRQTAHKGWGRYLQGGELALEDRSRRPRRCPTKTPAKVERRGGRAAPTPPSERGPPGRAEWPRTRPGR